VANPGFQTVNFGFQGVGLFGFQEEPGVVTPAVVAGHGREQKRFNEIIEIEGKRWSIPKDKVAEFLARFAPKTETVEIQTVRSEDILLKPVTFTTPTGKVIKTTEDVLRDDIGVILVIAALADEDFYEN